MTLTVLTGPPCSGKTTYIAEHRRPGDLVLDLDAMAHALGYPERQIEWGSPHPAVALARQERSRILGQLLNGSLRTTAWIIDSRPDHRMLAQYRRIDARIVSLDPGPDVCLARAKSRSEATREHIRNWYGPVSSALDIFA